MRIGKYILICNAVFLAGCFVATTKDINASGSDPMARAGVLPGETQLEAEFYRLAVLDVNDRKLALARNAGVGTSIRGELLKCVSKTNVVIVNNKLLPGLQTAIRSKSAKFSSKVDFAITGQVSLVNIDKVYTGLSQTKDENGKIHVTEPYCTYTALVQGNVRIHDAANNLGVVQTLAISGSANKRIILQRHSQGCQNLSQTDMYSLIRSAGAKAASREDVLLKNLFRPKYYVLEHGSRGIHNSFEVSSGEMVY